MSRKDIEDQVYDWAQREQVGLTRPGAKEVTRLVLDAIVDGIVKNGKLTLIEFGTFTVKKRKEKKGRNPQTGETVLIPARKVATFKAAPQFANRVAKSKA